MPKAKVLSFLFTFIMISILAGCSSPSPKTSSVPVEEVWVRSGDSYTYEAEYEVPGGMVSDTYVVNLDENQAITSVEATFPSEIGRHEEGVQEFIEALNPIVVGMNIEEVGTLDTISGASLTTDAFNEGLEKLKRQIQTAG